MAFVETGLESEVSKHACRETRQESEQWSSK